MYTINKYRNHPQYVCQKNRQTFTIYSRDCQDSLIQAFCTNPDAIIANSKGPFYKAEAGDTTTVGVIQMDDQRWVVKRYNTKNLWHRIKLLFRQSHAWKSWCNAHRLLEVGISTPKPIAIIEKRIGPFRGVAYFVTEFVEGIKIDQYFTEKQQPNEDWPIIAKAIAHLMETLKSAMIGHDDLQGPNILLVNNKPVVLDLDHMCQYSKNNHKFQQAHWRDVNKFMRFLKKNAKAKALFQEALNFKGES